MKLTLSTRSKVQIQTTISYHLKRDQQTMEHCLDAWLFVPKSLGINPHTYPRYLFYRDLQTWSELLPSLRPLSHMLSAREGLLPRLEQCIERSLREPDGQGVRDFETHNRAFCRILKTSIDAHVEYIRRKRDTELCQHALEQYLQIVGDIVVRYRGIGRDRVQPCPDPEFSALFRLSDEYLSLLVEESSCVLVELLSGSHADTLAEPLGELRQLALGELEYRREQGFRSVPSRKRSNERLVYRRGALATYVESVFYLSTRHKPEARLARELLLSMAAGMAMVFATAAAFVAHVQYENWTTTFFVVLVISYMFKDRIKAMMQDYLKANGQRLFFDFRTTIHAQTTRRPLGVQRESFGFVHTDRIDPEVLRQRDRDRLDALENDYCGEHIVQYKRRTKLHPPLISAAFEECGIDGISEIIQFDLTRFARKMDNSKCPVFIPGKDGYRRENGRFVYHLHVVIRFQSGEQLVYQHFRIVMTRDGVRRIDTVAAPAERGADR